MRSVSYLYEIAKAAGRQPVSFEIFPPKGDLTLEAAHEVAAQLADLVPDFVSVTYSAGGSGNKQATADVAAMIHDDFDIPTVAHLTCLGATEESISHAIDDLKRKGIASVLALRGDSVPGAAPAEDAPFRFAKDLIMRLADEGFCVGAAAYPEGHIECTDFKASVAHLKQKQDAGACFFVTQLFFDNAYYYRFRDAADAAGIDVPIACGVMPFLGKAQIQRMVFMCGASLPSPIIKLLAKYEDDPASLRAAGIEYACAQLVDLQERGADGLHVYTMNQPDIARACTSALRASWSSAASGERTGKAADRADDGAVVESAACGAAAGERTSKAADPSKADRSPRGASADAWASGGRA
ncbi:methylenetetrahydrofolate reductase [Gordonibacter massiliensis (ex Traore et al. 2017)]|uniref:methylenetetrahydrofolate reductase n=1 Tax=Gordonibacter massiliensis (ex Traore et al. 2017) TaxID=1841863 RepID=UPI001C8C1A8A|nr:methylenetetrahydrofolate reductase [Gordonibacter massiliensis (ex Traore et al. 2017)]MBX9033525.1 methylenetetrahydrofolate reductase [NAD(P)H] [Gordonibacter massiliensis (ex Traore et al. 2017)]